MYINIMKNKAQCSETQTLNRKIVEIGKINTGNTQIHDH